MMVGVVSRLNVAPKAFVDRKVRRSFGQTEELVWRPKAGPEHLFAAAYDQHRIVLNLNNELRRRALTRRDFAETLDVMPDTLNRKMRGEVRIQFGDAELWGLTLGVNLRRPGEDILPPE